MVAKGRPDFSNDLAWVLYLLWRQQKVPPLGGGKFLLINDPTNTLANFCYVFLYEHGGQLPYPRSSDPSSGGRQCQTLRDLLSLYSKTCNNCPRLGNNMLSCSTLHKEEGDSQRQHERRRRSSVKPQGGVIPKINGLGWWGGSWAESHSLGMLPTHALYPQQRMMERWWT